MAKYILHNIIKMKFLTPVHIGTGKETYDFSSSELHSDTLLAALAAMKAQWGETEDLGGFMSSFRLSSAFPYVGQSYFLPKPAGKLKNVRVRGKEEHEYRKKLKSVRYIDHSLFASIARGESKEVGEDAIHGVFVTETKDECKPFVNQVSERVCVPRNGGDASPFFFDWRYFNKDAGLYCITDAKGKVYDDVVKQFKRLGEKGLGTDKNVGGGKFDVEKGKIKFPNVHDANAVMLLSLFLPSKEDVGKLRLEKSKYSLLLRGGYMAGSEEALFRHLWKKSVYMFGVGSIFPTLQSLTGKVVNLSPDWNDKRMHPAYRGGKPFCLRIKAIDYGRE